MDETNTLIAQRKAKLKALNERGLNPFAQRFTPSETCAQARAAYAEGREVALAGRITAHRDMGKSQFMDLKDQSGRIQIYAQKQVLGDDTYDLFKHLDLGDFIGVRGTLFTTRAGEISVKINSFTILTKALRPPPSNWHGLEDTEIRYRQRYLDLLANDNVREVFVKRSAIVREIRQFLHGRGFLEVETPMMQAIPGGAAAQPFVTHHKALGCDFYLRIALELYLKRLLVGGFERVFELGRNFRNEGISRKHNPEFTMLEVYQAYGDYETMMELVQSLVCHVAQTVLGTLVIDHRNAEGQTTRTIDLTPPWRRVRYQDIVTNWIRENWFVPSWFERSTSTKVAIAEEFGVEVADRPRRKLESAGPTLLDQLKAADSMGDEARRDRLLEELNDRVEYMAGGVEDFEVTQAVFEKLIEPTLINPVFVTHAPKQLIPLAKLSPDDPDTVEVFECCINGQEIAPAYTEQNDPVEQRDRLEHQAGGEQQKLDEDFLAALEHGMPPAGGMGLGIDRLCMLLLGQESIRDVILFPQLRPVPPPPVAH